MTVVDCFFVEFGNDFHFHYNLVFLTLEFQMEQNLTNKNWWNSCCIHKRLDLNTTLSYFSYCKTASMITAQLPRLHLQYVSEFSTLLLERIQLCIKMQFYLFLYVYCSCLKFMGHVWYYLLYSILVIWSSSNPCKKLWPDLAVMSLEGRALMSFW